MGVFVFVMMVFLFFSRRRYDVLIFVSEWQVKIVTEGGGGMWVFISWRHFFSRRLYFALLCIFVS